MTTYITVKDALAGVLSKSMTTESAMSQLTPADQVEFNAALIYVSNKLAKSGVHLSNAGASAMRSAFGGGSPPPPPATPIGKMEGDTDLNAEVIKIDSKGQWSIEKAAKEGPALNYKQINPKTNYAEIEAHAPTYSKQTAVTTPAKKEWTGAAQRAEEAQNKFETMRNEPAIESIKRRQGVKKEEGILEDAEPSAAQKTKMTIKKKVKSP